MTVKITQLDFNPVSVLFGDISNDTQFATKEKTNHIILFRKIDDKAFDFLTWEFKPLNAATMCYPCDIEIRFSLLRKSVTK